ncbi:EF-hand domain-containing protein [Radicibacter daui]|uniref:EF-hand domain-containing protein n=1 Tax=Radicibacter daui TaxID=3064829 RepID=UPI004046A1B3
MQVGNISPANSAGSEALGDLFSSIDSDGSGSLSQDELSGFFVKMSQQTQGGLLQIQEDASGTSSSSDSSASADTMSSAADDVAAQFMAQVDQNGDGDITLDEFSQYLDKLASEDKKGPPPDDQNVAAADGSAPPPPPPADDASAAPDSSTDATTASSDSSSSGGSGGSSKSTDPADTNGDGVVSFAERMAYMNGSDGTSTDASSAASQSNDPMQGLMNLMMKQATSAYSSTDSLTSAASMFGSAA